ncbi:MAG: hypothetical protein KC656_31765, partial [Myxococcales bacterium]|nr:hypothetical protein [Myxococcales bacterium]
WTASTTGCFHAADTPTAWVAICTNPGDLPGVEGPYAVLWHDPADGTVLHGVGFELPERLFTLGEDVLLQRTGTSPSPVHGERGAGPYGNLLERYRPDGTLAASWWFPQRVIVGDAAAIGPDLTVVSVQSVQDFPGSVPTASGTEPHAVVLALSADGPVWEHALTGRIHTPELLGVDGGVLVLTKGEGEDLGAGPLADPDGEVGALVRMDACGRAVEQVVWTPDTEGATFHPRDLALDPAGDIVLQLASTGMYVLSPDVVLGDLDGGGLLGRFGKADAAIPACDDAPFAAVPPVVELELVGEATATLGTQICTDDCSLTVDRFQEVTLDVEAGDGWQVTGVSGACTELPCVLHADEPVTSVQVVVEATSALLVPSTGEVNALAAGATRGFVAGYCSPSVTVEIDGVVVADGPSGEGGYLGVLDTSGLVASTPLPTEFGGPVITDLTALP